MSQLTRRLVNSLLSLEIRLLTRTPHGRLLSRTAESLSSARLRPVSRATFSSRAPGGFQIDPIKPLITEPDSTERLGSSAIEVPAHDLVTVDHLAESPVAENPRVGAVDGAESGEVSVEEKEERPVSNFEEEAEGPRVECLDSEERTILPEELSRNVVLLRCKSADGRHCDVYLVGTSHVSEQSCREVRGVINFVKPQVVFLELCASRQAIFTRKDLKVPTMSEMIDLAKKKHNLLGIVYSWFLAKVADELEVLPGSEFRVAFEEARERGSKVFLGDRPVHVTLQRTWRKMPLWHKTKLLYSFLLQAFFFHSPEVLKKMGVAHFKLKDVQDMNDKDMLALAFQEMSKQFPTLMETLVDERDQYMSSSLLRVASNNHRVVAVVGKGHLQGIKKYWLQPIDVKKLMEIPSKSKAASSTKVFKSLGVGVAIVTGVYLAAKTQS